MIMALYIIDIYHTIPYHTALSLAGFKGHDSHTCSVAVLIYTQLYSPYYRQLLEVTNIQKELKNTKTTNRYILNTLTRTCRRV